MTLIVGVDIAKFKHVARVQDFRGVEVGKPVTFENTLEGFEQFMDWFHKLNYSEEATDSSRIDGKGTQRWL